MHRDHHRKRSRSRSPKQHHWGRRDQYQAKDKDKEKEKEKELPCYIPSGNLYTEDSSSSKKRKPEDRLKYSEPGDCAFPDQSWRFYVFKDDQYLDTLHISKLSFYVIGKDAEQCQIVAEHPSISKFHAVVQFRKKVTKDSVGNPIVSIRPYLLDLGSTNGTILNGNRIEELRYYEILEKDCVQFGASTREYVLLHDQLAKD
jgi:smad nuclear-interacting protein 1